jgi:hypothetical protein
MSWRSIMRSAKRGTDTPRRKEATDAEFEFDGDHTVVHLPTNARFTAYSGQEHYSTIGWGQLGSILPNGDDYEEETVCRIANKRLAFRLRVSKWQCPLCHQIVTLIKDGNPRLPRGYFETCKLKDRMAGIECIAFRQETRARELSARSLYTDRR